MANLNLNKTILGGRLTATPELKQTPNGTSVCSFSLAISRSKEETDFIDCVAWKHTAEFIAKYFKRGSSLLIEGSLRKRAWTDKNGEKRYTTEVIVDKGYFVDSKNEAEQPSDAYVPDAYTTPNAPQFEEVSDEDGLPF